MKLLWFTDLHLVASGERVEGVDPVARFERCLNSAIRAHPDAQRVIVSGDLAHRGAPAAYAELERLLARYPLPHRLIPGNHDDLQHLADRFYRRPGLSLARAHGESVDGWNLLYLNTGLCESMPGLDLPQIDWLAGQLEAKRGAPALIFMHHPPFPTGIPAIDREGFENRERFRQLLCGMEQAPHLLAGHCHRSASGNWLGIPFTTLGSVHLSFSLNLATTELRPRLSEPEHAVIVAEAGSVAVHFAQPCD